MVCVRFGLRPNTELSALLRAAVAAILALAVGACSTAQSGTSPADVPTSNIARADMEADGLEAQVPPPKRIREAPDDPSEPFSPNYGPPPPIPREQAVIPEDLPRDFRKRLTTALAE